MMLKRLLKRSCRLIDSIFRGVLRIANGLLSVALGFLRRAFSCEA
jgi:hypothetical protein